jgi:hypothetical protein
LNATETGIFHPGMTDLGGYCPPLCRGFTGSISSLSRDLYVNADSMTVAKNLDNLRRKMLEHLSLSMSSPIYFGTGEKLEQKLLHAKLF